ncbi:MAG: fimbrial protein [Scandinavium sp.]|uniref:fimbrial protein n=1 Tax=Scandinavium sp. TaxID=2830653 RepID=UPI003F3A8D3A
MKYNGLLVCLGMTATLISGATFANGKITFSGSITNAPCSITADSLDQTVRMGEISSALLQGSNSAPAEQFQLDLVNCDVTAANDEVQVEFSGTAAPGVTDNLGISGTAAGASITFSDAAGNKIKLGDKSTIRKLTAGSNTLAFNAALQGNGPSAVIVPGDFTAIADVKLSYQ